MLFIDEEYLININNISYVQFCHDEDIDEFDCFIGCIYIYFNSDDNYIVLSDINENQYLHFIKYVNDMINNNVKFDKYFFSRN